MPWMKIFLTLPALPTPWMYWRRLADRYRFALEKSP
jgi:hypothetical protein